MQLPTQSNIGGFIRINEYIEKLSWILWFIRIVNFASATEIPNLLHSCTRQAYFTNYVIFSVYENAPDVLQINNATGGRQVTIAKNNFPDTGTSRQEYCIKYSGNNNIAMIVLCP